LNPPILFEDNHIIIVNKRPGEIVQGDKTGDLPLSETIKTYLKKKYNKPGEVFLGVVHRIDRPVSGALVFARTSKALTRLNQMLKERNIRKIYWAVVGRAPTPTLPLEGEEDRQGAQWQTLVHYLKRNEKQNKSYPYDLPGPGRTRAELRYRKIAEGDRYDLLEVELITGRHHQIRAQLAAIGLPIRGDLKYGYPRSNADGSIHLHARQVELIHPVKKEIISITARPPQDKLWDYFTALFEG
jgi:23S rRNA pseudouridine1911/1915/1917 synthase